VTAIRKYHRSQRTIAIGEVSTLDHKVLDHAVEGGALITEALLAGAESSEVLGGLGHRLAVETNDDLAHGLIAMCNLEVDLSTGQNRHQNLEMSWTDLARDFRALGRLSALCQEQESGPHDEQCREENPPIVRHIE
jgi:hypothetical protein